MPAAFALVAAGRFLSNVALRLVFPFLPRVSAGLGVSLSTMGTALAVRDLAGIAGPGIGRSADRIGHPRAMVLGLTGLAGGLLMGAVSSGLWLFTGALIVISLAKTLFDVGSGAWIGEAVPFERRGRAIGLIETTWALSFIIAMPLAGLAIRAGTWRTPFLVASAMCLAFAAQLGGRVRAAVSDTTTRARVSWTPTIRSAIAAIAFLGLGHQMLVVTFAAFLENEHAVSVPGLGLTAVVFGVAELIGSGAAATFSDRLGQSRSVTAAVALTVPASLLLPLGSRGLVTALALMAVWFALTEFAIVSLLSLFSELDRAARGTVMGLAFGGWAIGHAAGAVVGSRLFDSWGMTATSIAMAGALGACAATMHYLVRDPATEAAPK